MAGDETPGRVLRPRTPATRVAAPAKQPRRKSTTIPIRAKSVPATSGARMECVLLTPHRKSRQSTVERETFPNDASSSKTPAASTSKTSARATKLGRLLTGTANEKSTSRKRRRASTPTPSRPFDAPSEAPAATAEPISTGLLTPTPSQDWQMGVADGDISTVADGVQATQLESVPETASARRTRVRCFSSATERALRATRLRAKGRPSSSASASAGDAQALDADHGAQTETDLLSETPTARPRKRRKLQSGEDARPGDGAPPPPIQKDPFALGKDVEQMDVACPDDEAALPPLHENPPVSTSHDEVHGPSPTHTRPPSEPELDLENEPVPSADTDPENNRPRAEGADTSIPQTLEHHPTPDPDFVQPPGQRKAQDTVIENGRTPPPDQDPPSTPARRPRPSPTRAPGAPQDRVGDERPAPASGSESGPRRAGVRPRSPHADDCAGAGVGVAEAGDGAAVGDATPDGDPHADGDDEDEDEDADSLVEPDVDADLHPRSHPDALDLDLDQTHDFQLLDVLDAAALPWVRTDLPRDPGADGPPEIESVALYLPPGVHQLIEAMKHALRTACAARARAEARCAQAMQAHLAAEQRVCELEAACAALAHERRLMRVGAAVLYGSQTQTRGGEDGIEGGGAEGAPVCSAEPSSSRAVLAGAGVDANAYGALAGTKLNSSAYADPSATTEADADAAAAAEEADANTETTFSGTVPRPSPPSPAIRSQPKAAYAYTSKGKGKMPVPVSMPMTSTAAQPGAHTHAVLARAAAVQDMLRRYVPRALPLPLDLPLSTSVPLALSLPLPLIEPPLPVPVPTQRAHGTDERNGSESADADAHP